MIRIQLFFALDKEISKGKGCCSGDVKTGRLSQVHRSKNTYKNCYDQNKIYHSTHFLHLFYICFVFSLYIIVYFVCRVKGFG